MSAAQGRIAETLETFYGAADQSSEGAMAGHAYKRSVDDLDSSFNREMVCTRSTLVLVVSNFLSTGWSFPDDDLRASREDVCVFPGGE